MQIGTYVIPAGGVGWLIALLVLIACLVLWLAGGATMPMLLGLIAALALSRLI